MTRVCYIFFLLHILCKESQSTKKRDCLFNESDYSVVLNSPCYVDKSLLIKEFLSMKWPYIVITAPRFFGKTVNMRMLHEFLKVRPFLDPMDHNYTRTCFRHLVIYPDKKLFMRSCSVHPVLYISFESVTGYNFEDIYNALGRVVFQAFTAHEYLRWCESVTLSRQKELNFFYFKRENQILDYDQVKVGLRFLTQLLHKQELKRTVVLIDDLDVPVRRIVSSDFAAKDVVVTLEFIRSMMSHLLKDNYNVDRALINACEHSSRVLLSTVSNVVHFPFLGDHPFARYYGLTEDEVNEKLTKLELTSKREEIADRYDGYESAAAGLKLYNPWSITNYLETEVAAVSCWIKSMSGLGNLTDFFLKENLRKPLSKLLEWKEVEIEIAKTVTKEDVLYLKDIINNNKIDDIHDARKYLQLMLDNGYFTSSPTDVRNMVSLKIPNNEIYDYLFQHVYSNLYYEQYFKGDFTKIEKLLETLNRVGVVEENSTVSSLIHFRDRVAELYSNKAKPRNEHDFLSSVCFCINGSAQFSGTELNVDKKLTANGRRAEIMAVRNHDGVGIVLQTKYNRNSAAAAIEQIVNRSRCKPYVFRGNVFGKMRVYIGLFMNKEGAVQVCCLIDTVDLNRKICV